MTILHFGTSTVRSPLRIGLLLIPLALACFAVSPAAQAVSPPPDGGYPSGNTAEGQAALLSLTTGGFNTAVGFFSLRSDTAGAFNTALGAGTLLASTADQNTATGAGALLSNTSGSSNTANGAFALLSNTTATHNTGVGYKALFTNNTNDNTAVGWSALAASTGTNSGGEGGNTAVGSIALVNNTAGVGNTATGWGALQSNTDAANNTAVGAAALAGCTGSSNTALGTNAGVNLTTGVNNIDIGDSVMGVAAESNTIRIGASQTATYIAGIYGETTGSTTTLPVIVDLNGQLGTTASSERFKTDIKPMDKTSETILALKPVTFHYKNDSKGTPQFGLVAEEVAKINPALVVHDAKGEIFTVRYEAVNAMLLNEFLKAHSKVEEQQATIAQLKKDFGATISQLTARLDEQATQIQKVSAQLEASKPAPQVVNNP